MSFALDLRKFAEKAKGNAHGVVREIVAEVAQSVDLLSPVGDASYWKHPAPKGYVGGHFRANWQLGVGSIPSGEKAGTDTSPKGGGGATVKGIVASIPAEAAGKVYWLANNVPYAQRLEDGWSRQAPTGVVGITAVRFQSIVDAAVAKVVK